MKPIFRFIAILFLTFSSGIVLTKWGGNQADVDREFLRLFNYLLAKDDWGTPVDFRELEEFMAELQLPRNADILQSFVNNGITNVTDPLGANMIVRLSGTATVLDASGNPVRERMYLGVQIDYLTESESRTIFFREHRDESSVSSEPLTADEFRNLFAQIHGDIRIEKYVKTRFGEAIPMESLTGSQLTACHYSSILTWYERGGFSEDSFGARYFLAVEELRASDGTVVLNSDYQLRLDTDYTGAYRFTQVDSLRNTRNIDVTNDPALEGQLLQLVDECQLRLATSRENNELNLPVPR